ncbi:MAG: fibrobacter succinogenes major paralogous domain-containing protein [Prevotellaceae bacterium]|jgi:uncharacterized protein (TIGR02145 family)|nr:fibrobacter succinogenes major paralogous domain-containing protein [Prevotellaceae bacterium]
MNKKSIISTASRLFAALTLLLFLSTASIEAQVTIGKIADPHNAAILDLSQVESQNLGLLLPHVKLTGLKPFQLLPSPSPQQEIDATGMVVYNEAHVNDDVYPGIYVWDGEKWGRIDDGTPPPPLPFMDPFGIEKSGPNCGNGFLFYIPEDYADWDIATNFVWELTSVSGSDYTPATVTFGSKNSRFFVPYDATERDYLVSVYANGNGSKQRSISQTKSQTGLRDIKGNFYINGADCYDIVQTDYANSLKVDRTKLNAGSDYSYTIVGTQGTPLTYAWLIDDPDNILINPPTNLDEKTINIQFNPEVLNDTWLIGEPTHEYIVVLNCVVTYEGCEHYIRLEVKVGDRDCCVNSFADIQGTTYTAVHFGIAGCWMTENLAVTKNQKQDVQLNSGNLPSSAGNDRYDPYYTFSATSYTTDPAVGLMSLTDARNSNFYGGDEGKPGLLYNWAVAVGARNKEEALDVSRYPVQGIWDISGDASRAESKNEDVCPVGWYLPSDAEWSALEREISINYGQYSEATEESIWSEEEAGERYGTHGQMMRNPLVINEQASASPGLSKPKESGFSGLLVDRVANASWGGAYGFSTVYWSSSTYYNRPETGAWSRSLHKDDKHVFRYFNDKFFLNSIRCKKIDK